MAQTGLENGQTAQDSGSPIPSNSAQTGASTSLSEDARFDLRVRQIAEEVAQRVTQSTKDKRIGRLEGELSDYRPVISKFKEYLEKGLSPEQAEREIEFQQIRDAVLQRTANEQPREQAGSQSPQVTSIAQDVIKNMGLSLDDPEVALVWKESGGDHKALIVGATALVTKRAKAPNPSPASTAAPVGGTPPELNMEQMRTKYVQEVLANRGNRGKIEDVKRKYLEAGLDIYNIPFTV